MAQGALKKSKPSTNKKSSSKLGPRVIAPKKASLVKRHKINKKLSSGLISKTERSLAQRAGHLELLASAKKDRMKERREEFKKK